MKQFKTSRKGFTLIEMLVVIAIIALLASILVPAVTGALEKANRMKVMANGRGIHSSVFATVADVGGRSRNYFAESDSDDYANSTEYFTWLMQSIEDGGAGEVLATDFSMFGAEGVDPVNNITDFDADGNPWSVVGDVSPGDDASIPFLITRNLNEAKLVAWTDEDATPDNVGAEPWTEPYGEDAIIVIRIGGGGDVIIERNMYWSGINPPAVDNDILQPQSGS